MNGIEYFQQLASGAFQTGLSEFQRHWMIAVSGATTMSAKAFVPFLFHVAKTCGRDSGVSSFSDWRDHKSARQAVISEIGNLIERPQIINQPLNHIQLNQLLGACDMLRVMPQNGLRHALINQTRETLSDADPYTCHNFINNFAKLAIYPGDDWIDMWWGDTASERLGDMKSHWLDNIVYNLAILDYSRDQEKDYKGRHSPCRDIAIDLLEIYRDKKQNFFPDRIIPQQIRDAAVWFDFDLDLERDGYSIESEDNRHSRGEDKFRNAFCLIPEVRLSKDYKTKLGHQPDISFQFNWKSFSIEIDGDPHMMRGSLDSKMHYEGRSRFQTKLAEKTLPHGVKLIRVPTVHLMEGKGLGLGIQQIAKAILDASGRINGTPVIMHELNKFVPTSQPDCWKLG